jgi:divalent metal cation (Fe/Co/Zn/Cd) transporter
MGTEGVAPSHAHHSLRRRGIRLEWATNGWNLLEVFISIGLGIQAQSLALIAFGLDSVVEVFASTTVIRNLSDQSRDPGGRRIHRSLRMLSVAFWLLGAFLLLASVRGLLLASRPMNSPSGIAWLAVTAMVMFSLAWMKRITGQAMENEILVAESAMSFLDGCLSSGVLLALILNLTVGWWWTDPCAALVVAGFAVAEGVRHWRDSVPHADCPPDI